MTIAGSDQFFWKRAGGAGVMGEGEAMTGKWTRAGGA